MKRIGEQAAFLLLGAIALVGMSSACIADELPESLEIEQRALAARRKITSGRFELRLKREAARSPTVSTFEYRVLFDERSYRLDCTNKPPEPHPDQKAAFTPQLLEQLASRPDEVTKLVLTDREYIYFIAGERRDSAGQPVEVAVNHGPIERAGEGLRLQVLDPRKLGIVPKSGAIFAKHELDSCLTRQDRIRSQVEREEIDGVDALKCTVTLPRERTMRCWIVPEMDYGVVRCELSGTTRNGKAWRTSARSRLEQDPDSGIWFPAQVEFGDEAGGETSLRETWIVRRAEINRPIPAQEFTLAALEIPAGRLVVGVPPEEVPRGYAVWNGKELVKPQRRDRAEAPGLPERAEQRGSRLWMVVLLNTILGVLFLAVWILRMRQSRR